MLRFLSNVCIPLSSLELKFHDENLFLLVLKSQGVSNSESYLQKVIQTYPKFVPILNTKIPPYLVSIIWNDPVTKEIASIFGNKQVSKFFPNLRLCSSIFNLGSIEFDNYFDKTKVGGEVFVERNVL